MRRKRRRPERAEEGGQLMSNSLLDDLITPSHLATGGGGVTGMSVRTSDQNVTEETQTLKLKTFLKQTSAACRHWKKNG